VSSALTGTTLVTGIERLVTMDEQRRVLTGAGVLMAGGRITAIANEATLRAEHPDAEIVDVNGGWVMPGMIDAHQHLTGDRLARSSIPDDLPPGESIFSWAVPLHAVHSPADDELSASLAALEAVGNGVTCIVEAGTVGHPERVVAGTQAVGVRTTIGRWGWDVEHGPYTASAAEVIAAAADLLDRFPPDDDDVVQGGVTLVGHDLMSDELVVGATELARDRHASITYHLSPTDSDPRVYTERTGVRPVVHLDRLGVLGDNLLLAHAVHLDDDEVERLLTNDVAIAACPWAYLRLGQGYGRASRHRVFLERGGRLALGCDSENASDQIDVLRAAALFAGLAKDADADPTVVDAHLALELATIRGAHAIGRGHDLGSIEVGKRADLVVLDPRRREWAPPGDRVALQLVWGTDGRAVRHVVVAGEVVVRDGHSTRVDEAALAAAAVDAGHALRQRAGLPVSADWPVVPA
jgi:5-methylthioadenosine/S-adenosylhomocysteine deaminase